jgi:hypothetical protein
VITRTHTPDLETTIGMPGLARLMPAALQIALVLLVAGSIGAGIAIRTNAVPPFDWQFTPDGRHILVIHNGPSPTCAPIPNPPQHGCFRPGPERREFSVDYITPDGVRSLVWLRLPTR